MSDQKTEQKPEWRKSDTWRRSGEHFLIEIYHYIAPGPESYDDGRHRWNVYAYVYPNHPHFKNFSGSAMWQDAATAMPFHAGPSFLRWFYDDDGKPVSVKVGSDYHHLGDDHFSFMAAPLEASQVFDDADQLFDWLAARTQEPRHD